MLFQPLRKKEIGKIVQYQFERFQRYVGKEKYHYDRNTGCSELFNQQRIQTRFSGARPLKRVIQQEVLNKLSREILAGNVNDGDRITLDYFEETGLVFRPVEK